MTDDTISMPGSDFGGTGGAADVPTFEQPSKRYPIQFDGQGSEYFRIWIVNIALSILTLGIYSAWATVRTRRYFYGKTSLDGTPFQYTAKPIPILIGRIIAFVIFGTYSLLGQFQPLFALGFLFFVIFPLMPWMIVKSQQFKARYSAWRNVSFQFTGTYGSALLVYVVIGLLIGLTFGLLLPIFWKESAKFQFNNLYFGSSKFEFDEETKGFWSTFWIAAGVVLGVIILAAIFGAAGGGLGGSVNKLTILFVFGFYGAAIFAGIFVQVRLFNIMLGGTSVDNVRLSPTMSVRGWAWVQVTNVLLLIVTLGIAYPWTAVRAARYKFDHLALVSDEPLDFEALTNRAEVGAAGGEMASDFGFEISLF